MARRSGRNGRIYIDKDAAFSGAAEPITTVQTWSISSTRDKIETTCLGDTSKQYIMGLGDASGSFAGLVDIGTVNWSTIADGNARKMYIYPDRSNHAGIYWFTTAVLDVSYDSGVNDLVKASVNWASASDLIAVGSI